MYWISIKYRVTCVGSEKNFLVIVGLGQGENGFVHPTWTQTLWVWAWKPKPTRALGCMSSTNWAYNYWGCIGQMHSVLYSVHTLGVHVPMQGAWLELLARTYILGAWAWAPYPSPCSLNFFRAFSSLKGFLWVYFGGFFKSILFGSISSLPSLYDINP